MADNLEKVVKNPFWDIFITNILKIDFLLKTNIYQAVFFISLCAMKNTAIFNAQKGMYIPIKN